MTRWPRRSAYRWARCVPGCSAPAGRHARHGVVRTGRRLPSSPAMDDLEILRRTRAYVPEASAQRVAPARARLLEEAASESGRTAGRSWSTWVRGPRGAHRGPMLVAAGLAAAGLAVAV